MVLKSHPHLSGLLSKLKMVTQVKILEWFGAHKHPRNIGSFRNCYCHFDLLWVLSCVNSNHKAENCLPLGAGQSSSGLDFLRVHAKRQSHGILCMQWTRTWSFLDEALSVFSLKMCWKFSARVHYAFFPGLRIHLPLSCWLCWVFNHDSWFSECLLKTLSLVGQSLYFPDAASWWLVISSYTKKEIFILDHFKGDWDCNYINVVIGNWGFDNTILEKHIE